MSAAGFPRLSTSKVSPFRSCSSTWAQWAFRSRTDIVFMRQWCQKDAHMYTEKIPF